MPKPRWEDFAPTEPGAISGVFGGAARYARRVAEARAEYEFACWQHESNEALRLRRVREETARHRAMIRRYQATMGRHHQGVQARRAGTALRDQETVHAHLEQVLARTRLPGAVPRHAEVAYSPRGEQAVVRFELPPAELIPAITSHARVGPTGELRATARSVAEIDRRYRALISQIALLYLKDLFESDAELESVTLSGHVHVVSPVTGWRDYPCLISVAVDRARYTSLDRRALAPDARMSYLGALVSRHPHTLEPVTPIRDFDLARYSFAESVASGVAAEPRSDVAGKPEVGRFVTTSAGRVWVWGPATDGPLPDAP